jgi:hypothetical protein
MLVAMRQAWVVFVIACGARPAPAREPASRPEAPPLMTLRADSLGPLTPATPATLVALREALIGYDVVPVNDRGLEFRVSRHGERLFDVIPDSDGTLLNVHVSSTKIAIADRPWRVATPFTHAELVTTCECWGNQPVCYRDGDHVAIALARACEDGSYANAAARSSLVGATIKLAIWSPHPLAPGGCGSTDDDGSDDGSQP